MHRCRRLISLALCPYDCRWAWVQEPSGPAFHYPSICSRICRDSRLSHDIRSSEDKRPCGWRMLSFWHCCFHHSRSGCFYRKSIMGFKLTHPLQLVYPAIFLLPVMLCFALVPLVSLQVCLHYAPGSQIMCELPPLDLWLRDLTLLLRDLVRS